MPRMKIHYVLDFQYLKFINKWKFTYQQHCKEKNSPDERSRQGQNKLRISEEDQSGSMSCYRVDVCVLEMGHVSKDWKYKYTSSQASASIDNAGYQCIPKIYLLCFKIRFGCVMAFLCLCWFDVVREKKKTISQIHCNNSMCCKNNDLKVMVSYANLQITLQLKIE